MTNDAVPAVPAVQVDQLRKVYPGDIEAVRGLTFEVAEGEIYGLLGPNGAGKSTTLGVLTTTVLPSSGRAHVAGHHVVREALAVRSFIGVVFQDTVLDNEFTGRDNLRLHARLWGLPADDARRRIDQMLATMGLTDRADDNVRTYSGGMRRRLEIARALLARPRVVFLDEPTTGLDPAIRDELWQLVGQLRDDEGVTIVLSTHYLEEAEGVCDRVGIVHHGRLVGEGPPGQLVEQLGPDLVELRVAGDPDPVARAVAETGMGRRPPLVRGQVVSVPIGDRHEVNDHVAALSSNGLGVVGSTVRRATLADVFANLTGSDVELAAA
jgi:ABC-2 type transport system ATP-binding protein